MNWKKTIPFKQNWSQQQKTEIFPKKIYVQNKAKKQTNKRMGKKIPGKIFSFHYHPIQTISQQARQIDRQTMDNIHSIVEYFLLLLLLMIIIIIINVMSIIHDLDRHHYDHHQAG